MDMEDEDTLLVNGRPIKDLRVVDLKEELDKRGLAKTGSKKQLLSRLKAVCIQTKLPSEVVRYTLVT